MIAGKPAPDEVRSVDLGKPVEWRWSFLASPVAVFSNPKAIPRLRAFEYSEDFEKHPWLRRLFESHAAKRFAMSRAVLPFPALGVGFAALAQRRLIAAPPGQIRRQAFPGSTHERNRLSYSTSEIPMRAAFRR